MKILRDAAGYLLFTALALALFFYGPGIAVTLLKAWLAEVMP